MPRSSALHQNNSGRLTKNICMPAMLRKADMTPKKPKQRKKRKDEFLEWVLAIDATPR